MIRILCILLMMGATMSPLFCAAQATPQESEQKSSWQQITINGFLSASYVHNSNRPDSQLNQLRVFDFHADKFVFDVGEVVVQKPVANAKDWGFRLDLTAGSDQPEMSASYGLFRDSDGKAGDVDIHQLFVSYVAPVGSGLRVDFGKFLSHVGYEVLDGCDGYNENHSRSFLFGYGGPYAHVGVRTSYTFSPKVAAMVMLAQGSDVVKDNNSSKTVGAQLTLTPVKPLTVYLNYLGGAERNGNNHDMRHTYDVVTSWKANTKLTFAMDALYGTDAQASAPGRAGEWAAVAGYGRFALNDRIAFALRGEVFDDKDGVRTGTAQRLTSFTFTPEYRIPLKMKRLSSTFVIRGDLRIDNSNAAVFEDHNLASKQQFTSSVNLLYTF